MHAVALFLRGILTFELNIILVVFQGFQEICERGLITGHKLAGIRFILEDGTFLPPPPPPRPPSFRLYELFLLSSSSSSS